MQWKVPAGALVALAFLIPAAPAAAAQTAAPGLNESCQTVERKVYKDFRELVTIDLDSAPVSELRLLAYRILDEAQAESLPVLPSEIEERLKGTSDDLRAYLKNLIEPERPPLTSGLCRSRVDSYSRPRSCEASF
ncbi:hypothetical protein AB0893_02645, partial [Micromonospora aurantiaca]